jgi:pimeloyl-ACP methyl ester carboxylesterase
MARSPGPASSENTPDASVWGERERSAAGRRPTLRGVRFQVPPVRYATRRDGLLIAYQVVGDSGPDLIFLLGWPNHLALQWELPAFARFLTRLGSFSRLILFDRPSTGLSDRGPVDQAFEDRMDDILSVMDAVGSDQTALFGCHLGGRLALLFAATYPQRTRAVVTFGAHPTTFIDEDYPWGISPEGLDQLLELVRGGLTEESLAEIFRKVAPEADAATAAWWRTSFASAITSHEAVAELSRLGPVDIRATLGSVRVPTLIMHRSDDLATDVEASRYMAERIPGARFVELAGSDHLPFLGDAETVLDLAEEFLTGATPVHEPDRVLATIMFTDIVDSTVRAAELGDRRWKETMDGHNDTVRRSLAVYRGHEVRFTGDGFLATFDGAARSIRCADEIRRHARALDLDVRIGLHTGEFEIQGDDVGGIAVHIAARVMALASANEIVCSRTVKDLTAGSGLTFEDLGERALKGVPEPWQLYRVVV